MCQGFVEQPAKWLGFVQEKCMQKKQMVRSKAYEAIERDENQSTH